MDIALPGELEEWIEHRVRSGHAAALSEVVLEAVVLRLRDRAAFREMKLKALREDLEFARLESEQGLISPMNVEDIIARGRKRLAEVRDGKPQAGEQAEDANEFVI